MNSALQTLAERRARAQELTNMLAMVRRGSPAWDEIYAELELVMRTVK